MSLNFKQFDAKLEILTNVVMNLTCDKQPTDITEPIFRVVADGLANEKGGSSGFRTFFFDFARGLLAMKDGNEMATHAAFMERCASLSHTLPRDLGGANYAEYLTATSLALYFLGKPFSHPWERVLSWVEREGEGLPNGACVGKAIGDIVRNARITNCRSKDAPLSGPPVTQGQGVLAAPPLMIHSHMPIILHESYVTNAEVKSCVPSCAHLLGHCYELLQIRLYAHQRLPFIYFAPKRLVKAKLEIDGKGSFDSAWTNALTWMRKTVFPQAVADQFVGLLDTEALHPVFLNETAGLYTSARAPEGNGAKDTPAPLPATFLRQARVPLYRETLMGIPLDNVVNLLSIQTDDPLHLADVGRTIFS